MMHRLPKRRSKVAKFRSAKSVSNERKYPNIVELAVTSDGLAAALSNRIVDFHKSRNIQPRHGRTVLRERQTYYRWCFSDLGTACDFIEQFGGALCETGF
jgi:hypothetical protein